MKKVEIYEFLNQLIKDTPKGEWQIVTLAIREKNDHWEIKVLEGDKKEDK